MTLFPRLRRLAGAALLPGAAAAAAAALLAPAPWRESVLLLDFAATTLALLGRARAAQAQARVEAERRREAEERITAIVDHLPARISQFDQQERTVFANRFCGEIYGCAASELVGRTMREVRGAEAYEKIRPLVERVLRGEHVRNEHALVVDGHTRHFRQDYIPALDARGHQHGFYSIAFEITDFRRAEAALSASERRLRDIADNMPALIAYIDPQLRLQFANRAFGEWTGVTPAQAIGRPVTEIWTSPQARERLPRLHEALAGESVSFEAMHGPTRHTHVSYLPDRRADGSVAGVYALAHDITAMKRVEHELDRLSRVDPLTGLPNRREFDRRLADAIACSDIEGSHLGLMFLDIDRFKSINDRFGHGTGDAVLVHLAQALREAARPGDLVARLAGDEFVVVLAAPVTADDACRVAAAAIEAARRPLALASGPLTVSASIGVALYDGQGATASELLACADEALYEAKQAGRDKFRMQRFERTRAVA